MAFEITLGFVREHDMADYEARVAPRLRGPVRRMEQEAEDALHRLVVAVPSAAAAKDVVTQTHGFLAHAKNVRIDLAWPTADAGTARGELTAGGQPREADLVATRVAGAARAALKATAEL